MSFARIWSASAVGAWALVLAAELEYLLVNHYSIRTELRSLFGLPIYHILLTLLTIFGMTQWLSPSTTETTRLTKPSPPWILIHLLSYAILNARLDYLWLTGNTYSVMTKRVLWSGIWLAFLTTWLAGILPFQNWKRFVRRQAYWLTWVLPLSILCPYAAEWSSFLWTDFGKTTFMMTSQAIVFLYDDPVIQPDDLVCGTSVFNVQIQPGCSGYEGIGLILTLIGAYLWLRRRELRLPVALVLLPVAAGAAYLANLLRLITLIMIGTELSPSIAMRGFHSQAGWLSFTILGLLLIWLVEDAGWLHRSRKSPKPISFEYPALPYLVPAAGVLFATMLVQATSGLFPYSYPLKPLIGGALLAYYCPRYQKLQPRTQPPAFLVGIAVLIAWVALTAPGEGISPYVALPTPWSYWWIAFRIIGAVIVIPICEELAFRGYLFRRLQSRQFEQIEGRGTPAAYLISSVAFGILHSSWQAGFFAGLAYAWVSTLRGGVTNAIVAHSLTNLGLSLLAIFGGRWGAW